LAIGHFFYVGQTRDQLSALVATCVREGNERVAKAAKKVCDPKDLECAWEQASPICEPDQIISWSPSPNSIESAIQTAQYEVSARSSAVNQLALLVAAVAFLPALWYFILARIREIGNAVRGK
jgi:hypothetical protein